MTYTDLTQLFNIFLDTVKYQLRKVKEERKGKIIKTVIHSNFMIAEILVKSCSSMPLPCLGTLYKSAYPHFKKPNSVSNLFLRNPEQLLIINS